MIRSLLCAATLFAALPAHAALDEILPKRSPETTTLRVAGHTLRVRSHGIVKEFADADGKVFAATWRAVGQHVDLMSLLGSHAEAYKAALRKNRGGLHHVMISTPELGVVISENQRLISGKIWLPAHLPTGVTLDALR